MRIGASLVLIAVGAILAFAINVNNSHGFNINTAGIILIVVGALGLLVSLIWMSMHRTDAVQGAHGQRRTTVVDETAEPRY